LLLSWLLAGKPAGPEIDVIALLRSPSGESLKLAKTNRHHNSEKTGTPTALSNSGVIDTASRISYNMMEIHAIAATSP
jgi:hypothetical protein